MKNKNSGFTLVELMVCIVLMGLLAAAFVPGLGMVYKQDVKKATELMCSDLTVMKDQSKATGNNYKLEITTKKDGYVLDPPTTGNGNGKSGSESDNLSGNIRFKMYKRVVGASGSVVETEVTQVNYKAGKLFDSMNNIISELKVEITYDGDTRMVGNIVYDGITGHYTITY